MQREFGIDDLPQPGEPLQPDKDTENQKLLEDELTERIKLQSARLSRREKRRLQKRWKKLHKQLNEAGYNQLVVKRTRCWKLYTRLKYRMSQSNEQKHKFKQRYFELKRIGQTLTGLLDELEPLSSEFDDINRKLKGHQELLEWEREDRQNFEGFKREARTWEQQIIAVFRQSPRLHHKYVDHKGRTVINTPEIREIIVKDDRVQFLIKTTGQSAIERLFGRWHSALPYGVDVTALTCDETLENLSTSCNRVVSVERSQRGTNLFYVISRLDAPDGVPKKVLYSKIVDWYPANEHAKTPWCAGITEDRKTKWYNFEDHPHVLIAGATQGGKSNHVNQMIATMTTMNTPDELRLMLVDLKGGIEFTHWRGLQHQLKNMLTTPESVLEGLQWLQSIMEKRLEAFESLKAKNLASFNEKAEQKLPRIVCFVDEMATLIGLGQLTTELHTVLRVLSSQGRAVGIHLVLCTQHSSVDVLPGWVKTNMVLRVSAKMPNHQASMVVLDTVTASTLPDVAGRMVFSSGRQEFIAQSPFITDNQIATAVKLSQQFKKPDDTEFISVLPKPEAKKPKFGREDILRMALEFNGHLSAQRVHDVVGNETMSLRSIRAIVNEIKDEWERGETILIDGQEYTLTKNRKAYYLEPIEQPVEQENTSEAVAS